MVMEVNWYADRNGINDSHVKVTERSSIDLLMTLRLFIKIEPHNLRYGINSFNIKVIVRLCYRILHNIT